MHASLSCGSGFLSLRGGDFAERRPLDVAALEDFSRRYALARERSDAAALLALGRALYDWLNGPEDWLKRLWAELTPPFVLEIETARPPDAAGMALLQAPWELLADVTGFLAADAVLRYAPVRRLGPATAAPKPDGYRLGVAFMAAAPYGAVELDHEAEEAAILGAAGEKLDLFVEESGNAEELGQRLVAIEPALPVLHLSGHGHNAWRGRNGNGTPQPVLMLESATGTERPTSAGALLEAMGAYRPRVLFLSACLTAASARPDAGAAEGATGLSDSLASRLVRAGVPAVLGWDGSVADVAATAFARVLYDGLGARRLSLAEAASAARRALLNDSVAVPGGDGTGGGLASKDAQAGTMLSQRLAGEAAALRRDWHLARVWLGPDGGGPVVGGTRRRLLGPAGGGAKKLLLARGDERLEVADPAMFVGRRRELQKALGLLETHGALLLHGMGRLGKSSLAARIADRRPDLRLVVVYRHYDALSVVDVLSAALEEHEPARSLLAARRSLITGNPADAATALRLLLIDLLAGPCREAADGRPVLLLVDDTERILEADPAGGQRRVHQVRLAERPVVAALLRAFTVERGDSRLVFTSRFPFSLVEGGHDLAASVETLELSELSGTGRRKLALRQVRAARGADGAALGEAELAARLPLLERSEAVSRGNPGLQDLLGEGFVLRPGVPPERAAAVLAEMTAYLQGGALPPTEAVRVFLQNLAVDELVTLAGAAGTALLRAATLFDTPVPAAVIEALAAAVGGVPARLRDLGLLMPSADLVAHQTVAWAVNGLVAGRLTGLAEAERAALAAVALPSLFTVWGGPEERLRRPYEADHELTRLALIVGDAAMVEACAAYAVHCLAWQQPAVAADLGQAAIALLEARGQAPPLDLLAHTAAALETAGDGTAAGAVLGKGSARLGYMADADDIGQRSAFLFQLGSRQMRGGAGRSAVELRAGLRD